MSTFPSDLEAAFAQEEADPFVVVDVDTRQPIGMSWKFDFQQNEFVPGGASHGPLKTYGMQTLYGWIEKCLRTDRGAHLVHPPGYGLPQPFGWYGQPVGHLSGDLEARIRDALTFHPRITGITDFKHDYDPSDEWVTVEFTVVLDNEETLPVTVSL